ncbi:uncharacterized protein LOC112506284 [Cynara cardunculus var. scolymus]|uniref:Uncharacterized protein n=1 Tax=Cynara cardunculus var. scolymus TaxID=59895 RepID=A0A103YKD8_CYNCS|nr:uncharacterized protein LOC112506284 [Cynara cardunculus var. scolymus]KVI10775.1 hypothetical protein Ccrd_010829 [Cynara cardunculus var. scolymus]
MSSTPALDPTQQQPSPFPPVIQEQAYKPHSSHGSVGPVIGVLAVIMVMGAVAVMIGRLCSGRRIMGHGQYDFEGWVETKCSTCIDGRLGPPPRRETVPVVLVETTNASSSEAAAAAAAAPAEIPADEAPPQADEEAATHQPPQEQHNLREN